MQKASSMIWTWIAETLSYDGNNNAWSASLSTIYTYHVSEEIFKKSIDTIHVYINQMCKGKKIMQITILKTELV